jgi:hypothetical protein
MKIAAGDITMNQATITKLPVHALRAGNILSGSRETVVTVSVGISTPRGKIDVLLEKGGRYRTGTWGRHTMVNVVERGQ